MVISRPHDRRQLLFVGYDTNPVEDYYAPRVLVNEGVSLGLSGSSVPTLATVLEGDLSDVITEHQLLRMRFEINLPFEVADRMEPDIVADEGDWNN